MHETRDISETLLKCQKEVKKTSKKMSFLTFNARFHPIFKT